jgi:Polysaccharide biosynthesis protein
MTGRLPPPGPRALELPCASRFLSSIRGCDTITFEALGRADFLAAVAPLVAFAARFGRTVILSRLLVPGEFGVAVAIMIVITTAELATDVGLDKFVLLKSAADARQALAAAQALQIFRGLLLSAAIAVLAVPAVTFFGIPQAVASFEFAALVPLVRSFVHLGIKQIQRDYDYRPDALAVAASSVAGLAVVALDAATILPDHRVIILAFLVDAAVYAAAGHPGS